MLLSTSTIKVILEINSEITIYELNNSETRKKIKK